MTFRNARATLAASLVLLVSCSGETTSDPTAAIEASNKVFVEHFLKGDEKALAGLYTEDAEVVAPGAPIARGRDEIARLWRVSMDSGIKGLALKTTQASADADLAYEDGTVSIVRADDSTVSARYLVVWKRVDGKWYMHRDIWNVGTQ